MACEKTVYLVDKLTADNRIYHKACFRCHHCKGTLKEYKEYISRMASHNSDLDETSIQVMHKSNRQKNYLDPQFEKRPTLSYEKNPPRKMYSSMNMKEDSAREALLDIRDKKEMRAKHYGRTDEYSFSGKMKVSASSHRLGTYDRGLDRRQIEHTDYGDVGASITHKRSYESRPFNFPAKHNITSHSEERDAFKRATKECDTYGERRQFDGYYDPVEVSDFPANVTRPAKRPRENLLEQRYAKTAGMDVATLLTNPNRKLRAAWQQFGWIPLSGHMPLATLCGNNIEGYAIFTRKSTNWQYSISDWLDAGSCSFVPAWEQTEWFNSSRAWKYNKTHISPKPEWRELLDEMAVIATKEYRSIVFQEPRFVEYFRVISFSSYQVWIILSTLVRSY